LALREFAYASAVVVGRLYHLPGFQIVMTTAFEKLSKGKQSFASSNDRVTSTEEGRQRRAKSKRFYFEQILLRVKKLRRCKDIVLDWEDWTPKGFRWWSKIFEVLTPPPEMTVDEWADQYRRIPAEFAAEPGDWRTSRVPSMREVMRACSPSHDCRRVVLVKPVQSGGTEAAILNTIGHTIDVNPRSMIVVFPTLDLAESFSKERLEPMVRMIPRLNEKVAEVGMGPAATINRSSIKKKRYPGGFLNLVGANSTSGLSSRPVPIVLMDEVDDCIRNAGQAGNPTRLLSARTTTFPDKKEIFISSPSNEAEETGIIQMWEDSTQGWLETQCPNPQCAHWQVLEFERMDLDSATLACEKCGQYFPQWQWNWLPIFRRPASNWR
jgi:phage terminase large subunit GpA-like protein